MKIKRKITIDTDTFELGDIISFKLATGEKVQARAVQETPEGMLFMTVDCLKEEQPMFECLTNITFETLSYDNSDLCKILNKKILVSFPTEIKDRMKIVYGDNDFLRIPTEREIFGENFYGQKEYEVKQFDYIKSRRDRIAGRGCGLTEEWYWLMNRIEEEPFFFAIVNEHGNASYFDVSSPIGVRLVFCLSNNP